MIHSVAQPAGWSSAVTGALVDALTVSGPAVTELLDAVNAIAAA